VRNREQVRALFVLVLNHASRLSERPRFYNTLTQNCTNTVMRHIEYLTASEFPWWDYRLILPGYIDLFLYEMGAIDSDLPMAELRQACLINERVLPPDGLSGPGWSAKIRAHVPEPAGEARGARPPTRAGGPPRDASRTLTDARR
jgi:hypothetical protein